MVPSFENLMLPFLQVLELRGRVALAEVTGEIAERLSLTQEALDEMLPSGRQTRFRSRVGWARTYLTKAGLAKTVSRGVFELTPEGRTLLATRPDRITKETLMQFASFREWVEASRATSDDESSAAETAQSGDVSPEEAIAEGHRQLENALVDEVLDALLGVTWQRFEEIVVDVLQALGYGRNRPGSGHAFRKAGDGGVDGVIDEDPLGLSKVYVQAKKYALDRTVGRPDVQAFVGSLLGVRSKQGVYITTCTFTAEARAYADSLSDLRVILVDGPTLARLMIKNGVGVAEQNRYVIMRLDSDYFTA